MSSPSPCRSVWPVIAFLALAMVACEQRADPTAPSLSVLPSAEASSARAFQVYTQNLYLGGDTGPLFTLDFGDPAAVLAATNTFWQQVQASKVPERAAAIAAEIDRLRPDVVGLQEATQFVVLDGELQPLEVVDPLSVIEAELAARGLSYVTEGVQPTTTSALPLVIDPGTGQVTRWLRFTDREVALRRADVPLIEKAQGVYDAAVPVGPLEIQRGWVRLSVDHFGTPYHFVTTHLEVQALAPYQAAQVAQLLGEVLDDRDGFTVLAGDLNSDAAAEPGDPSWTPTYGELLDAGFEDAWAAAIDTRGDSGFTCCQAPDLTNPVPSLDQRIDFVLVRAARAPFRHAGIPGAIRSSVVGNTVADLTSPSGLWPADHAGLTAAMRLAAITQQ